MTEPVSTQPSWLAGFAVPAAPSGAVIALDFGDAGLWAGRVEHGRVAESETETRIRPEVLDARIAAYLRDTGAVDAASPEAFGELVIVVGRGRQSLIGYDSSLTMGYEHLRLVRLGLDEVVEATVPEANRAHGMIVDLAGPAPVDAVLLGPGHDLWPGLWEALTERGFAVLQPGDDFPEVFGGDDRPTDLLAPVAEAPQTRAWEDSGDHPALVDPADYDLDRFGNTVSGADHRDDENQDETAADTQQPQGLRGRVVALGIVVMLAVGGGAFALALNAHERNGPQLSSTDSSAPSSTSSTGPEPERVNISVDQGDLDAARAPMAQYTTPPPPPPKTTPRQTEARPGPKPPAPTEHRRKTVPNPIPGLPPIVIG